MALLNINSLLAHIDDLKIFVTNSTIDTLAINETKLDSSISDSEISPSRFEVIRRDCTVNGRCGGSVCIYWRNNINYHIRHDLNCDTLHNWSNWHILSNLINIFDIYGLSQMISEPTRITSTSRPLIHLCITNSPKKLSTLVSFILGLAITHLRKPSLWLLALAGNFFQEAITK